MQDLDIAKSLLKKNNDNLVIVKNGTVLYETVSAGIGGLLTAIEKFGKELRDSSIADKIVGEAAAQLCAYSNVIEVFAMTLSQCGKDVLDKNSIRYEYEKLVPHILSKKKTDLCPFEKQVAGCKTPQEAYEKLTQLAQRKS